MAEPVTDEWSDALTKVVKAFSDEQQRLALSDLGYRLVIRVKQFMSQSLGFATAVKYKPLLIRWRYHGRKTLVGGSTVNKTAVTSSTRPLIDTAALMNSWDVTSCDHRRVDVSPKTNAELAKAYFNDDRGDWTWEGEATAQSAADFALSIWARNFDRTTGFA